MSDIACARSCLRPTKKIHRRRQMECCSAAKCGDRNQSPNLRPSPVSSIPSSVLPPRRVCLACSPSPANVLFFLRLGVSCAMQSKIKISTAQSDSSSGPARAPKEPTSVIKHSPSESIVSVSRPPRSRILAQFIPLNMSSAPMSVLTPKDLRSGSAGAGGPFFCGGDACCKAGFDAAPFPCTGLLSLPSGNEPAMKELCRLFLPNQLPLFLRLKLG